MHAELTALARKYHHVKKAASLLPQASLLCPWGQRRKDLAFNWAPLLSNRQIASKDCHSVCEVSMSMMGC